MAEKETGFSAEEREAMKAAADDKKKARSRAKKSPEEVRAEGEADLKASLAKLSDADRAIAEGLHDLVSEVAPELVPRTYYGMPAWAKDGKVLCFFQPASKFKTRYGTFGFEQPANLDDGTLWPTAYAVLELDAANREFLAERVRAAVS
ncbi:iron chaperone [Microbacterium sp. NPDC089696]|uniref:iron chaperone n=1 Tax=Microbacterium sp. NPDC089696 TaxID=3364199 RepID=UPI003816A580